MDARFDRGGDQHIRDVMLSPAKQKDALLDDGFDFNFAWADDFPRGGNGSSVFREGIGDS